MLYAKVIIKLPKLTEEQREDLESFKNALIYCADANNIQVKVEEERVWDKEG